MSTRDSLDKLGNDPFDFIGSTARPEQAHKAKTDPANVEPTKQISARLPMSLYKRWKMVLMDAKETQETLLVQLIEQELGRRGG